MPFNHRDLWDTNHIKAELAGRLMSERKTFVYFLALMAFDWLQFTLIRVSPASSISRWAEAGAWFTFALTVIGLLYLFACNGGALGRDFLYRYFPLSVVVGWKFVVAMFAALWIFGMAVTGAAREVAGWGSVAIVAVLNVAMFIRIGQHLKRLARDKRGNT
jgi:hypothetical protein